MIFTPCPKIDTHLHLTLHQKPRGEGTYFSSYDNMLPHLEKLNIAKGVVMSNGESPSNFASNEECRAIYNADPEHYAWMCGLDPVDPDTVYDRLKTYKAQGAVGIGEVMINRRIDDPFLRTMFDAAGKLDLPITFHMSPEVGYSYGIVDEPRLPLLEQALKDFPDTKFVGHSQSFWIEISGDAPNDLKGRQGYGSTPVVPGGRIPELLSKYPNLYCDLSADSGGCAILRDPDFGLSFLEWFSDRFFFATDMLNNEQIQPLGAWLDEQAANGNLSQSVYEKICCKNAQRIYGLSI